MQMSAACMACLIDKQACMIRDYPDETAKAKYMQAVLRTVSEADKDASAPVVTARINALHREYFGYGEDLSAQKSRHNRMMLRVEDGVWDAISKSDDPLRAALQYARAGNYIDLGAMKEVSDEKLASLLDGAREAPVDETQFAYFREALARARNFLYIADNAGEIVMDKLLIRALRIENPALRVTLLVRGRLTSNDATPEDAREVGIDRYTDVLGNGTDIAGTDMRYISPEALRALHDADLILAKGQGNFETLLGCGLPIFYIFLCKCDWFVRRFGLPRFTGVFTREQDVSISKYLVGDGEA